MLHQRISPTVLVATLRNVAQTWEYHPYRLLPLLDILHRVQHELRQTDIAAKIARLEQDIWTFHFTSKITREQVVTVLRQLLLIFDTTPSPEMASIRSVGAEVVSLLPARGE